jgi:hypothetical protein
MKNKVHFTAKFNIHVCNFDPIISFLNSLWRDSLRDLVMLEIVVDEAVKEFLGRILSESAVGKVGRKNLCCVSKIFVIFSVASFKIQDQAKKNKMCRSLSIKFQINVFFFILFFGSSSMSGTVCDVEHQIASTSFVMAFF